MATSATNQSLFYEFPFYSDNVSELQYSRAGLLDVYYSPRRFAAETVCALVAATANISVLVAMRRAYDIMAVVSDIAIFVLKRDVKLQLTN